jgi:hypothetical protein
MAAVKNVLKHVSTEMAGKRRRCYHHRAHEIVKGEMCLVVRDGSQSQTTYCSVCATEILAKANKVLAGLQTTLSQVT